MILFVVLLNILFCYGQDNYCANDKITVTETEIDYPIVDYHWLISTNNSDPVVFVRTDHNTVWRSSDEGATWKQVTELMKGATTPSPPSNKTGIIKIIPTIDPTKVFFLGNGYKLWTTTDAGATYSEVSLGPRFTQIFPHPTKAKWAAAFAASSECLTSSYNLCHSELWMTQDLGQTWQYTSSWLYTFSWGVINEDDGDNVNIYLYTNLTANPVPFTKSHQQTIYFDGTTAKRIVMDSAGFVMVNNILLVVQVVNGMNKLLVSKDGGKTLSDINFPGDLAESFYTIMELDEDAIFINIRHPGSIYYGTTFVSDDVGSNFTASLTYNVRRSSGAVDFTRIEGLDGIYFANQLSSPLVDKDTTRTMVSFDKGAQWQVVSGAWDKTGTIQQLCVDDDPDCSLHLHGVHKKDNTVRRTSVYGPLHTSDQAIGLILATGNVGTELSNERDELATYLSIDAGWTWYNIANGTNIYEYADHGALIALMDSWEATNTFSYTWDEGLTMASCNLSLNGALEVDDIIAHPHSNSQKFNVFGYRVVDGVSKGVIIQVDFTSFHQRVCTMVDYYNWFPKAEEDQPFRQGCLLGQETAYVRRIRESQCYNGRDFETTEVFATCPCTREDYECDYCFENIEGHCSLTCDNYDNQTVNPATCVGNYSISRGYRLVADDKCDYNHPQALNLLPIVKQCQNIPESPKTYPTLSGGVIALIVVLVVAVIVAAFLAATDRGREYVKMLWGKLPGKRSEYNRPGGVLVEDGSSDAFSLNNDNEEEDFDPRR